jgi:hypothetical protein
MNRDFIVKQLLRRCKGFIESISQAGRVHGEVYIYSVGEPTTNSGRSPSWIRHTIT